MLRWGEPAEAASVPPHWELATGLGLLDSSAAAKIAGAGFLLFTGRARGSSAR